jgi:zinc/manganese transport system permease protein
VGAIASATLLLLALIYRPLVAECFDPGFMRAVGGRGSVYHLLFLFLLVINLVAAFQALGTLMAVGLMMLPASVARLWTRSLPAMAVVAAATAILSGYAGLTLSYHLGFASGPSIILMASAIYGVSLLVSPSGVFRMVAPRHRLAG